MKYPYWDFWECWVITGKNSRGFCRRRSWCPQTVLQRLQTPRLRFPLASTRSLQSRGISKCTRVIYLCLSPAWREWNRRAAQRKILAFKESSSSWSKASLLPDSPADPSKRWREREMGTQGRCDFRAVRNVCVCGERNKGASFASVWQRAIELGNVRFFLADGTMCAVVHWRLIPVTGAGLDTAQVDVKNLFEWGLFPQHLSLQDTSVIYKSYHGNLS